MNKLNFYKLILLEFGFLNPQKYIDEMTLYYDSHGWPRDGANETIMRYWMRHRLEKKPQDRPELQEAERNYLRSFLDIIPECAVCRFCDLLLGVRIYPTRLLFKISGTTERVEKMDDWLTANVDYNRVCALHKEIMFQNIRPGSE